MGRIITANHVSFQAKVVQKENLRFSLLYMIITRVIGLLASANNTLSDSSNHMKANFDIYKTIYKNVN